MNRENYTFIRSVKSHIMRRKMIRNKSRFLFGSTPNSTPHPHHLWMCLNSHIKFCGEMNENLKKCPISQSTINSWHHLYIWIKIKLVPHPSNRLQQFLHNPAHHQTKQPARQQTYRQGWTALKTTIRFEYMKATKSLLRSLVADTSHWP